MKESQRKDVWGSGDLYEPYVGRWSRLVARAFLEWLDTPKGSDWLDVGCGTGALTQTIIDRMSPRSLKSVDRSPEYVEYAKTHVTGNPKSFEVADAQSLPFESSSFDVAVTGLVLNFVQEPSRAAAEMARVVRSGGVVAAYVWDYAGKMEMMRYFWDAAVALDPAAGDLDEGRRFPICGPEPLAELFANAGLDGVEVRPIDVSTNFRDFDDYWSPFLGGQGPAPGYAVSLDDDRRGVLRDRIRSRLPIEEDGSIHLIARTWAVRGHVL